MGSPLLGAVRLALYLLWTLVLVPFQALALALKLSVSRDALPRLYHRLCARVIGLELQVVGTRTTARPTLFVANHSSYLDIEVLGALIPGSFVAKAEVARWPFFGVLAKLQRTVFVDRRARGKVDQQRDDLRSRLAAGDNLILFPEGTSSDGNRVLPFKSALFAVAALEVDDQPLTVQPVSVTATALDGMPLGHNLRSLYAWYGDMALAPHLWTLLKMGRITVTVQFHPPVTVRQFSSRKALSEHCWQVVAHGVAQAVAGRLEPAAEPEAVAEPEVAPAVRPGTPA